MIVTTGPERRLHLGAFRPSPALEGLRLATPAQRLAGFAIDVVLLALPSVVVAVAAAIGALAIRDPEGLDAAWKTIADTTDDPAQERVLRGRLAALLVEIDAEGVPPGMALAVEGGDLARAGDILDDYDILVNLGSGSAQRRANQIKVDLDALIPIGFRGAALFGVAAFYFSVLTSGRRRTVGKMITGTRVLPLDGRRLTLGGSFERFGGYFATVGTFGLGLLDLWREPNRRLAHDRLANTIVVDATPDAAPDHSGVVIPPPFVYVAFFLVGALLDRLVPIPALPIVVARSLAPVLVAAAAGILGWSFLRFRAARTSPIPVRPTTALVLEGPYRISRNPMYVALLLLYIGVALWFGFVWPLLLAPFAIWAMQRFVIAREERYLERKFGAEYREYRASVRRWL